MTITDPCCGGCLLGFGEACANRAQPWRPYPLPIVCHKIHTEGNEGHRRLTIERTTGEVPSSEPTPQTAEQIAAAEEHRRLEALIDVCPDRGPQMEPGCGCKALFLCRRDTRLVNRTECAACVSASLSKTS